MPVTDSFLATCRGLIEDLPELTTFQGLLAAFESATGPDARRAAWHACFSDAQADLSPAHRLRRAIRDVVLAQADGSTSMNVADRESAYRTLADQYVTNRYRPPSNAEELAVLSELAIRNQLD